MQTREIEKYHLESKDSIEVSLVILPSFCLAEPFPVGVGFADESLRSSPSLDPP